MQTFEWQHCNSCGKTKLVPLTLQYSVKRKQNCSDKHAPENVVWIKLDLVCSVLHTWGAGGSGSSPTEGATRGEVGQNGRQSVLGSIGVRVVMRWTSCSQTICQKDITVFSIGCCEMMNSRRSKNPARRNLWHQKNENKMEHTFKTARAIVVEP